MRRIVATLALLAMFTLAGCAETPATQENLDAAPVVADDQSDRSAAQASPASAQSSAEPDEPASTESTPRKPLKVSGFLPVVDALSHDQGFCGSSGNIYRSATKGLAWEHYSLPEIVRGWSVRIDAVGYMLEFGRAREHLAPNPTIVPTNADFVHVCNQSATTPFQVHFMPPELVARLDDGYRFEGLLPAPDPTWRDTRHCFGYGAWHDPSVGLVTQSSYAVEPDMIGQPFMVDGDGVTVHITHGRPRTIAPLGIVPEGSESFVVCNVGDVAADYVLRVGRADA